MDILRKMFKLPADKEKNSLRDNNSTVKDEFRKPQWFEEAETDDELFDEDRKCVVETFTNPVLLQEHFERQLQQVLKEINEMEENRVNIDRNVKEEFLKPGFEESFFKEMGKKITDSDLDGEIYGDQLHSLISRFNTVEKELPKYLPRNDSPKRQLKLSKNKLTDEELIMGKIHGTIQDEKGSRVPHAANTRVRRMAPILPRQGTTSGGVFDGTYQGPKMFKQSIITRTVRKPDGSYETTKISEDSIGNRRTTTTRTIDGKSETVTVYDGVGGSGSIKQQQGEGHDVQSYSDRNIYVTKEGYAMPRNLW